MREKRCERAGGRVLPMIDYNTIKAATRHLVTAVGGQEAAAFVTRVSSHQTVGRYVRPQDKEFAPVDMIADWEREISDPIVTRQLARLAGYVLVPVPEVSGPVDWSRDLAAVMSETGEAVTAVAEALASDGEITADEVRSGEMVREIAEAIEKLALVQHHLRDILVGGDGS